MTIPAWFWPPSGATARGISLVPFGAGMAVPDWTTPTVWPFSLSGDAFAAGVSLAAGTPGLCGAAPDGSSGIWTLSWTGTAYHISSGGTLSSSGAMPSGRVYVGVSPSGHALASDGTVYSSGGASFGSFGASAWFLQSSGATLFSIVGASGVGTMTSGGASGFIAAPSAVATPSCLTVESGLPLAVAGWATAPALSGMAAAALDPQDAELMLAVGSGAAVLWTASGAYADNWSQTQALTGLVNLSAVAWTPAGTMALAPSVSSGVVQVLGYSAGVLSLLQSLAVSGACAVAVDGSSSYALVAQSGQSQIATLTYSGGSWTVGSPVTGLPGIAAVASYGSSGAVAAWTSGLAFLNLATGAWSVAVTASLPFAPQVLTVDRFLQVYAAGSGAVSLSSGTALLASGAWSGGIPTAIAVQQGRILLADTGADEIRIFALSASGVLSQQGSSALGLGAQVGLALSNTTLFAMGSGSTVTWGFSGTPFTLTSVVSGAAALWNGSTWTTAAMGVGHTPMCCTFDPSGNLWVGTAQNTLWSFTSGGAFLSSGSIPQYAGQSQSVPLGASSLLWSGGHLWCATSVPGVLVEIQ